MIQVQTNLKVSDNSGAKNVRCIKVLGGFKKTKTAQLNPVVVSIQKVKLHKKKKIKVKEGDVIRAVIVRTKAKLFRKNSSRIVFKENAAVLLSTKKKIVGSRIVGAVAREFKHSKYTKIALLSSGLV